ncbi:MAG: argininosuccinate lyase [bacterium]|nr:argininosuccinate lyase [bacterium]MBU1919156.1 argininosuccinate lyase [bacterium]
MKLWDKGQKLNKSLASKVEDFCVGNDYLLDQELVPYDVLCSKAHADTLLKAGLLTKKECTSLHKAFNEILVLHKEGKFPIKKTDEDCHSAIENYLTKKLGDVGKKIHTGRSRNDQVLAAMRKLSVAQLTHISGDVGTLAKTMASFAKKYKSVPMPGFTHMQKAMPSSIALWAGSFKESFQEDSKLMQSIARHINKSPLGSAAGYGTSLKLDRQFTATQAGFNGVHKNVLFAQSSRLKYHTLILDTLKQVMMTVNRLASDLMLFTMDGSYKFFSLPDEFTTGSSIMPQKKNYDLFELIRGHQSRIIGYAQQIAGLQSNLISGYNRDVQLDKEPLLRSFYDMQNIINLLTLVFKNLQVHEKNLLKSMTKELYATEQAYKLVEQGMPFREAYKKIAKDI